MARLAHRQIVHLLSDVLILLVLRRNSVGQGVTRRPWVQPTQNVYNGKIVSPHELAKGGTRCFAIFGLFVN